MICCTAVRLLLLLCSPAFLVGQSLQWDPDQVFGELDRTLAETRMFLVDYPDKDYANQLQNELGIAARWLQSEYVKWRNIRAPRPPISAEFLETMDIDVRILKLARQNGGSQFKVLAPEAVKDLSNKAEHCKRLGALDRPIRVLITVRDGNNNALSGWQVFRVFVPVKHVKGLTFRDLPFDSPSSPAKANVSSGLWEVYAKKGGRKSASLTLTLGPGQSEKVLDIPID
jgi:hypothetical protein